MAWNVETARIKNDPNEVAKNEAYVNAASALLLEEAKSIMEKLANDGLAPQSVSSKGTVYNSVAEVSVKQGTGITWSNGQKVKTEMFREQDGQNVPVMFPQISIKSQDTFINLIAKEDISSGIILQDMTVKKLTDDKHLYKLSELKNSPKGLDEVTEKIVKNLLDSGIIHEKPLTQLQEIADKANTYFSEHSPKVESKYKDANDKPKLVNDAYATYNNDPKYGEKVTFRNHHDKKIVEIGIGKDNNLYARAVDFDNVTEDGKVADAKFINTADDLTVVSDKHIAAFLNNMIETGLIKGRELSPMEKLAMEMNTYFAENCDKVESNGKDENGNSRLVNDAYASYENDPDYGERVELRNHHDNVVVNIGYNVDGSFSAYLVNFDKPAADGKGYEYKYITTAQDLELVTDQHIAAALSPLIEEGVITEPEITPLKEWAINTNKYFTDYGDKVESTAEGSKGEMVNDAYAKYVHDKYGEKVLLRNHRDKIVVEVGFTKDNNTYAKAVNFDRPIPGSNRYESIFINKTEDLENLSNKNVIEAVAAFKQLELPKLTKEQATTQKGTSGKEKPEPDDDYPF